MRTHEREPNPPREEQRIAIVENMLDKEKLFFKTKRG